MQKPQESLDDFFNRTEPIATTPPPAVQLRPTGEFETLKPLARWEWPAIPAPVGEQISVQPAPPRFSWFHRSLIFGGAAALIALVFLSAILTAISEYPEQAISPNTSGYPTDAPVDDLLTAAEETATPDIFIEAISPMVLGGLRTFRLSRPAVRSSRVQPPIERAAYKPRRRAPKPQPVVSDFVPTTLVIYAENGEIKTRIEPNLTAVYTKTPVFDNAFRRPSFK